MSTTTDPTDEIARLRARVAADHETDLAHARRQANSGANGIPARAMKRAVFEALPVVERMTFARNGGKVID